LAALHRIIFGHSGRAGRMFDRRFAGDDRELLFGLAAVPAARLTRKRDWKRETIPQEVGTVQR
jgi:hypothetical protein